VLCALAINESARLDELARNLRFLGIEYRVPPAYDEEVA
jgi:hypothetical protein